MNAWCDVTEQNSQQDDGYVANASQHRFFFCTGGKDGKGVHDVPRCYIGYPTVLEEYFAQALLLGIQQPEYDEVLPPEMYRVYHYLFTYNTEFRREVLGLVSDDAQFRAAVRVSIPMSKPSRKHNRFPEARFPAVYFGRAGVYLFVKPQTAAFDTTKLRRWVKWSYAKLLLKLDETKTKTDRHGHQKVFYAADKYDRPIGSMLIRLGKCTKIPHMMEGVNYIRRRNPTERNRQLYTAQEHKSRRRNIPNPTGYKHTGYRVRHCDTLIGTFTDPGQSDDDRFSLAWWSARRAMNRQRECASDAKRGPKRFVKPTIPLTNVSLSVQRQAHQPSPAGPAAAGPVQGLNDHGSPGGALDWLLRNNVPNNVPPLTEQEMEAFLRYGFSPPRNRLLSVPRNGSPRLSSLLRSG